MNICIVTRDRIDKQVTLEQMTPELLGSVTLYCHPGEREAHMKKWGGWLHDIVECPEKLMNIAQIRHWICCNNKGRIIFADDDLFFKRVIGYTAKRIDEKCCSVEERARLITEIFNFMWDALKIPNVAVTSIAKAAAAAYLWKKNPITKNERFWSFWGLDLNKYFDRDNRVFMNQVPVKEDFLTGIAMRLLGYDILVNNRYCWDSWKSNSEGGCSNYRTKEMQNKVALMFAGTFPDFVKIKNVNRDWGGKLKGMGLEIQISWKKIPNIKKKLYGFREGVL